MQLLVILSLIKLFIRTGLIESYVSLFFFLLLFKIFFKVLLIQKRRFSKCYASTTSADKILENFYAHFCKQSPDRHEETYWHYIFCSISQFYFGSVLDPFVFLDHYKFSFWLPNLNRKSSIFFNNDQFFISCV